MQEANKDILKQTVYPVIGAKKIGLPKISNFWEEEEVRPLHLLQRNLIMDRHFRRGPFLNEYMYQDALAIEFRLRNVLFDKEFYFTAEYKGQPIDHKHFLDFRVMNGDQPIIVECKAVDNLTDAHRQQLWNYMRLTGINFGVLYNFAPAYAKCEKYFYDPSTSRMLAF